MTTDDLRMQGFSEAVIAARRAGGRFVPEAGLALPQDLDDAHAVQQAVAAVLGPVGGFKTAKRPNEPRIVAPIFAADVLPSPATVRVPATGGLGIELEVGLRLKAPLDRLDGSAASRASVFEPVAVIEIVDTRIDGPQASAAMVKLADNQINGALIVGGAASGWDGGPLRQVTAFLRVGDRVLLDGAVAIPGGDAVDCIVAMAAGLGDRCGGFRIGQIAITGTLNPLEYFPAGTDVEGRIEEIGGVAVQFA
jgi:2-keto-4-pentenoate hydratase